MATVTSIEPQKRARGRFNVHLDDEFWIGMSDDTLLACGIGVGDTLSADRVTQVEQMVADEAAARAAGRLLGYRARSRGELRMRLAQRGHCEEAIEHAERVAEQVGALDERSFCEQLVTERRAQGRGRRDVQAKLAALRADRDVARQVLTELYPSADEPLVAAEWASRNARQPVDESELSRLQRKLAGRGFGWDAIREALEPLRDQ